MLSNLPLCCAGIYSCVAPVILLTWFPNFTLPEADALLILGAGLAAVAALMRRKGGQK